MGVILPSDTTKAKVHSWLQTVECQSLTGTAKRARRAEAGVTNEGRLNDRKLDVLRAIVQDYVQTREPVGSKALVERHSLGVSPATIRNEMAALEDEGYIHQPHTR